MQPTELFKVRATRCDERVIGRERARRDRVRAPEAGLGLEDVAEALADDAKIVERVREVRVRRAERTLLQRRRVTEMTRRSREVVRRCSLLRRVHDGLKIARHLDVWRPL